MSKIEKLTPEQEALMPVYRDRWLEIGLSTAPTDKDKIPSAVAAVYTNAGREPPKEIAYVPSPNAALDLLEQRGISRTAAFESFAWNNHDAGSLGHYDFFLTVVGLKNMETIKPLLEIAKLCGWVAYFDTLCVVQERPTLLKFDDARLLHCEDGPAIQYSDGYSVYIWHGTTIPQDWVEDHPPSASEALQWPNMEQRLAACQIVGWANILKELNAKTIDRDDDPMIGELLEAHIPDVGTERFLRVLCGTGREFALQVPPDINTALEANAWTYDIDGDTLRKLEVRT
jgi:hypothetical protein